MIRAVVAREDNVYKAFPDLTMCSDGMMICIYRESTSHRALQFSRIVMQESGDGGRNWSKKQVVHEFSDYDRDGGLNNPRILYLGDKELIIICDWIPPNEQEYTLNSKTYLWRSRDNGRTWEEMKYTGINGHICPSIFRTGDGTILIGADAFDAEQKIWSHDAYISKDGGKTFRGPITVASSSHLWLNEGSFVELADGTIVCYIREDKERIRAYKALSKDGGETWEGPFPTHLLACVGRPRAGLLRSGEVAVTYGFSNIPRQLVLHVEDQEVAADPECMQKASHEQPMRRVFIDQDRSIHPDAAYSGWVQLESGAMYVVQYITDDAPMAHIRSYIIDRNDWLLSPEGLLGRTHAWKTLKYHEEAVEMTQKQFAKLCNNSDSRRSNR